MPVEMRKAGYLKIAATYIGTVIGAGFASGQEIYQFFTVFKEKGLLGILLVVALFILYGYIMMELGFLLKSDSYLQAVRTSAGRHIGTLADFIILFLLFGTFAAMLAGAGALSNQLFKITNLYGNIVLAVITMITVFGGMRGLMNSLSAIVPFLLICAVGTSLLSLVSVPGTVDLPAKAVSAAVLMGNWAWSAILYVSYNIVTAISILAPLGNHAADRRAIIKGSVLGGLGLGVCAVSIYLALSNQAEQLLGVELPMLFIAGRISYLVQNVYAVVLLVGIYTTAAGCLYGLAARVASLQERRGKALVAAITLAALGASYIGFSNLVKYVYPAAGYLGILLLVSLLYGRWKLRVR